ncbi:MAG: hypothetical protein Q7T74_04805 [Candidatus Saccharibacteria bacterium]|nr:hypothetical protein [Candidatus Saccharibacteria bacterium]
MITADTDAPEPVDQETPQKNSKTRNIIIFIIVLPVICFFVFVAGMIVWITYSQYQMSQEDDKFISSVRRDLDAQLPNLPSDKYKLTSKKVEKLESVFIHYPAIYLEYKVQKKLSAIQVHKDIYNALIEKDCKPGSEYVAPDMIVAKNYGFDTSAEDFQDIPVSPPNNAKMYGKSGSKKPYICNEPTVTYAVSTGTKVANAIVGDAQTDDENDAIVDHSQDIVESFRLSVSRLYKGE